MLHTAISADLMTPTAWKKAQQPLFGTSPEAKAFGAGHNAFFKSPDGKEDWIVYHANPEANKGCGSQRSPRMQPIKWKSDGTPDFGKPAALGQAIPKPSGLQ